MASEPMRDPVADLLLTPKNSTLIIIDYQPLQVTSIKSMNRDEMIRADAVGGTSAVAHEAGLRRIEQAGGKLISVVQLICELQRDWVRTQTLSAVMAILGELSGSSGVVQELMTPAT